MVVAVNVVKRGVVVVAVVFRDGKGSGGGGCLGETCVCDVVGGEVR